MLRRLRLKLSRKDGFSSRLGTAWRRRGDRTFLPPVLRVAAFGVLWAFIIRDDLEFKHKRDYGGL